MITEFDRNRNTALRIFYRASPLRDSKKVETSLAAFEKPHISACKIYDVPWILSWAVSGTPCDVYSNSISLCLSHHWGGFIQVTPGNIDPSMRGEVRLRRRQFHCVRCSFPDTNLVGTVLSKCFSTSLRGIVGIPKRISLSSDIAIKNFHYKCRPLTAPLSFRRRISVEEIENACPVRRSCLRV
jgi:hypothetical protein